MLPRMWQQHSTLDPGWNHRSSTDEGSLLGLDSNLGLGIGAGGQGWSLPLVFFLASKAPPWTRRSRHQGGFPWSERFWSTRRWFDASSSESVKLHSSSSLCINLSSELVDSLLNSVENGMWAGYPVAYGDRASRRRRRKSQTVAQQVFRILTWLIGKWHSQKLCATKFVFVSHFLEVSRKNGFPGNFEEEKSQGFSWKLPRRKIYSWLSAAPQKNFAHITGHLLQRNGYEITHCDCPFSFSASLTWTEWRIARELACLLRGLSIVPVVVGRTKHLLFKCFVFWHG